MDALQRRLESTDEYSVLSEPIFEAVDPGLLIASTILLLILGSLAAGAGIGGGGLFVPIYAFILGIGAKAAVPLSKATILGAAIGNFMILAFKKHPNADRPIIDYEASTFMQSGELLGVIFGVLLNILLPELLIIIFLAVLLSYNALRTLRKGVTKYKAETEAMKKAVKAAEKPTSITVHAGSDTDVANNGSGPVNGNGNPNGLINVISNGDAKELELTVAARSAAPVSESMLETQISTGDDMSHLDGPSSPSSERRELNKSAAIQFPVWAYVVIVGITIYTVVYAIVKAYVLTPCYSTSGYWGHYFTPVFVLGGAMLYTGKILNDLHERRAAAGYKYLETDIRWTNETLKKFPTVAMLAGVAAGLLGIGGGMVIGPLFMEIGLQPQVGTSSCAFMILWTATSGVFQYMFAGKLGWQFALYFACFGFISGQLGQRGVDRVLKKTGRPSFVVLLLGSIIAVACLAMSISGVVKVVFSSIRGDPLFNFSTQDFTCQDDDH